MYFPRILPFHLAVLSVVLGAGQLPAQTAARHPLDPLTAAEITRAVTVLRQAGHVTPRTRFGTIAVEPRGKGTAEPRAARILSGRSSRDEEPTASFPPASGCATACPTHSWWTESACV